MAYTGYVSLRVTVAGAVARVVITNPPLNLLDAVLIADLNQFATEVRDDGGVRVIVLASADADFFVAHGDMTFSARPDVFAALADPDGDPALNPMEQLHEKMRGLPQVTIAEVAGLARGGGAELAMSLDLRFAALDSAGLAQPETMLGIIPGGGGTQYLTRLVGRARALEIILGGALFDAELAERYGWVNRALPADELGPFVDALARRIAALPPGVASAAKAAVDGAVGPLPQGLREENELLGRLFSSPAGAERTNAALAGGAQTREGERDLERVLNDVQST